MCPTPSDRCHPPGNIGAVAVQISDSRSLRSIGRSDLLACLDRIVARGARVQANHCLVALKQFYRWCEARDWVDRSPLTWIAKKQVGGDIKERDRVLSLDEIRALRDQLPQANLERHAELAIWILLSTLVRVGELSQAAWKDVDLNAGVWYLPETKNGQPHAVHFGEGHLPRRRDLRGNWSRSLSHSPLSGHLSQASAAGKKE